MTTDAVLDTPTARLDGPTARLRDRTGTVTPLVRRTARVMIVDPEPIVRFGLRRLFAADPQLVVVGDTAAPRDALLIADRCPPDLVITDVQLGRGHTAGVDLARVLLRRHRGLRVLVFTGCRDREVMMRTVRLGVHGYLRKGADIAEVSGAVHALLRGESVFDSGSGSSPLLLDLLPGENPPPARSVGGAALTDRENQVLRLLAVGLSNREIGGRLVISEATVKFHVRNLRDKLDVRRRTEIVYTATRQGIV